MENTGEKACAKVIDIFLLSEQEKEISKKILLLIFACMLAICSLGHNNAFGKGTYYPDVTDESLYWDYKPYEVVLENINFPNGYTAPYPRSLHAFVWGKWPDYPTYNDWTTVRSDTPDSTDDYSLTTNLSIAADTLPRRHIGQPSLWHTGCQNGRGELQNTGPLTWSRIGFLCQWWVLSEALTACGHMHRDSHAFLISIPVGNCHCDRAVRG